MEIGDIVRLKREFSPEPDYLKVYNYGVVVGLVPNEPASDESEGSEAKPRSRFSEVIVQLYDPETATIYMDEFGTKPMFYFRVSELAEALES